MGGVCSKRPNVIEATVVSPNNVDSNTGSKTFQDGNIEKVDIKTKNIIDNDKLTIQEKNTIRSVNTNGSILNLNSKLIKASLQDNDRTSINYFNLTNNVEFRKGECIGSGKLGSVYSGLSTNTGEIVAIKSVKLNKDSSLQKQIYEVNEAVEKLSQLSHKNIIRYICTQPSEIKDEIDIIFEYCNGGSIKQLLERYGKFDEKLIKLYVKQILEGLVYLHDQNIVHRNIKNCNVLVDGNGTVKLSDFVVSNILVGDDPNAILFFNTNNGKDPPYWMAPEIINKEKNLTCAVDIWSLGCIIIEMATKNPPWSNITTDCKEILHLIATSTAPPKFPSHVSKDLKSFLNCCLQKNPLKRSSARKLLEHNFFQNNIKNQSNISPNKRNSKGEIESKHLQALKNDLIESNTNHKFLKKASKSFNEDLKDYNNNKDNIASLVKTLKNSTNNKLLKKNVNIKPIEEEKKEEEKKENMVNFLDNNDGANAFFSLSMTVYSQQSIIPQIHDMILNNKDNKILPPDITEVDEYDNSPLRPKTNEKKGTDIFLFNPIQIQDDNNVQDELNNSERDIQCILDNYNMNNLDLNNLDNIEKLATLELKKEDMLKLEAFFKERNNKMSIGPIERDKVEHFLKQVK